MLEHLPADSLLSIMTEYQNDTRPEKIDLGVGIFKDEEGNTPVLKSVKVAEQRLLESQNTKAYLGAEGDRRFTELVQALIFGEDFDFARIAGLQTPGGTGALRLAADLLAISYQSKPLISGTPTWENYAPILKATRNRVQNFSYFDIGSQTVNFESMLETCASMSIGQPIILQVSGHNPTGADLSHSQWEELIELMQRKQCVPLFDFAYHGMVQDLESDSFPIRRAAEKLSEVIVTYSCSKNFGLYRERTGGLFILCKDKEERTRVMSNMLNLSRSNWSMPPDHGAAIVRTVLDDKNLRLSWRAELREVATRTNKIRKLLSDGHPKLEFLNRQCGMFSLLQLSSEQIDKLRDRHAIYLAQTGRINITGMKSIDCPRFIDALIDVGSISEC